MANALFLSFLSVCFKEDCGKRELNIINKSLIAILFTTTLIIYMFASFGVADGGRVTARDVLKHNKDADIIEYDGKVFSNVTNLDWFKNDRENISFSKDNYVGKIQNQTTSSLLFNDLSATKLPKGTKIYSIEEDNGLLLVEFQGKELYYMELLEG
ncbi:hypothetical protein M3936_12580 [Sutcliffiella horikoshii]|uniref:hypothetical protein n=1 Tax=Sutcliffiella horikoshii TaxID=79883 RepID=UPI00203A8016|nr:hypothetical protein [Sutcliffiella horikoshii]MCM3618418.1 hypothetical protein [Sutcliffiella horikoshii]